ncbi:endonuclease/exonuclease/phosphatase family protein [Cognatishimia sp. SS12]|uniref:endonuclease/exonuclease/phosphatase family protein n=1 Tax=Cognatishimia sp. SS12 TaxID=2979465 RepID=UPI00232A8CED|nr:endonuclease/exonuclease/phosphatase family protein [Cognatishimia sp. SS12]MDC0738585.1 endonuclease/exonuclease/phosphatase family protein [Cognatishimia sp. SS12]
MRLATYNIEWFSSLFDDADQLVLDGSWSSRRDVTKQDQAAAIATVLRALDADAVLVVEAPDQNGTRSTVAALENFAAHMGLRTRAAVIGFSNDTQQEIALLYDPEALSARHAPMASPEAPRFDQSFAIDLDVDAHQDLVVFSKPPLELALTTKGGTELRLIGAHLKSKAPHGARNRDEVMRISIANRRKQLAQAVWLRRRIESLLAAGEALIVAGDLNDGPGLDEYEDLFGRSSVEIILGEDGPDGLYDPHARRALERRLGASPTTSRFFIHQENRYLQALLDYLMISQDLRARQPKWRIWHPFDDVACWNDAELRAALLAASDHFPVTLDLAI